MTLGQQDMSISSVFPFTRHTARLSVKLLMGVWLVSCVPVMAQTPNSRWSSNSRLGAPILIAQRRILLREGDQGAAVRELQLKLNSNGLFPATIDGFYGSETTQAVRQFQRIRRLNVTGIADEDTLDELGIDLARLPVGLSHPVHGAINGDRVTANSSTDDVRTLQLVLRSFGFNLSADGIYGPQTAQAVRAYQRTSGLSVDGIAARSTLIDMGFSDDGRGRNGSTPNSVGSSRSDYGNYVAAIITTHDQLGQVQDDFPNATPERNNLGEYISIGRFVDPDDADNWVDFANDLGYEARVIRD
jgi:hypothetical protein